jgi:cell division initiation protein
MSANSRITVVDIQHRTFKRALQGYDRTDVDKFLDEIIESLEDEATARAALEAEIADLKERISHFKAMEESLQSTLLLAQRTADEVKAAAHKEADLIKQEARLQSEREIGSLSDKVDESRREHQRMLDIAEKAKSEIRGLVLSYLALIDRAPYDATAGDGSAGRRRDGHAHHCRVIGDRRHAPTPAQPRQRRPPRPLAP